jgi:hypothetical protein
VGLVDVFLEFGEDEVTDSPGAVSLWGVGVEGEQSLVHDNVIGTHRDLKEPEGWRSSSLRKMRL